MSNEKWTFDFMEETFRKGGMAKSINKTLEALNASTDDWVSVETHNKALDIMKKLIMTVGSTDRLKNDTGNVNDMAVVFDKNQTMQEAIYFLKASANK